MAIGDYCVIGYWFIGMILTVYWWFAEYKKSYEECKAKEECEDSMVIVLWLFTTYIWPAVLCIRFIAKRDEKRRQNQLREFQERNRNTETT